MLTRCPSCATTFRITPDQLKARNGRVRCGQCQAVFNALATLVEEVPAPPAAAAAAEPAAPAGIGAAAAVSVQEAAHPPPEPASEPAFGHGAEPAPEQPDSPRAEPFAADAELPPPAPEPLFVPREAPSPFADLAVAEPPRRAWPWAVGAAFAALALALQAVIHFRVELAVAAPEAKPLLAEMCTALGCELPLPSRTELVSIEASDLHPDTQNPGRLQLAATLKNRAPHAQQYPHMELTLTDTNDTVLLRRVLAPADYLPKSKPAAAGFAAGADLAVSLALEVKDLAPVGYRLYVFYP